MKFHIVAVDDEQIALDGLRSIPWESYGFELTAALNSADEAERWLQSHACDLVIADVRMPGTSGLELAARIREAQPDVMVMLLSGHSEFEYAQEALRQGVFRYLLKPLDDDELASALSDVRNLLEERERRRHWTQKIVRDYWFRDHLRERHGREHDDELSLEYLPDSDPGAYRIVYAAGSGDLARAPEYRTAIYHSTYLRDSEWAWVVREEDVEAFFAPLARGAERLGVSLVRHDLAQMRDALAEARYAADAWFRRPEQGVYTYEPPAPGAEERERACYEAAAVLADRIASLHAEDPAQEVSAFLRRLRDEPFTSVTVRRLAYTVALGLQRLISRMTASPEPAGVQSLPDPFEIIRAARHLGDVIDELPDATRQAVQVALDARAREITDERLETVLAFLDEHYHEPISLDDVAEVAGMHPSRFSTWFKATHGVNYIDYLTRLRIERAKERMRRPEALVKDVAAASGFQDSRYFAQVFKKLVGIPPSRYQFLHVGRNSD